MLAEALIGEGLSKQAQEGGLVSGLVDKIKDYVGAHIDPTSPTSSLLNILAPGVVGTALSAMGLGWFGWLISLAMDMFHVDVASILSSIWSKLKGTLSDDKKTTSQEVHSIVESSIQEHVSSQDTQPAHDDLKSSAAMLRHAKLMRLAMEGYANPINKFAIGKGATVTILGRVLSLFFRVAIAAAGLMVAGDVVNKMIGAPNALDGTLQHGQPTQTSQETSNKSSLAFNATNTSEGITAMLLDFAKEQYPNQTSGQEEEIQNLPSFKRLVDTLAWYNHTSVGGPVVFIPKVVSSKSQLVDYFMHDFQKKPSA